MSEIGGDPDDLNIGSGPPGNQPDGSFYNLYPASPQPGLIGGQYATMMANSSPDSMAQVNAAALGVDPAAAGNGLPSPIAAPDGASPIDASFIARQEGEQKAGPYPVGSASQFPNAGVTVATGVDLGAHTADDLKRWGVSDATITALTRYLGLKGQAALDALNDPDISPPTIGQADLDAMDQGVLNDTVGRVQKAYDAANPATSFSNLSPGQRTAIVDLAYQFGTNLKGAAPKFWGAATAGDWNGAVNQLNHFYGPAITPSRHDLDRRAGEAGLIQGN